MRYCQSCGHVLPDESRYCLNCGAAVLGPATTPQQTEAGQIQVGPGHGSHIVRNVAVVVAILLVAVLAVGAVNASTTTVATGTYSGQSVSLVATCHGFGTPSLSLEGASYPSSGFSLSTNQFGNCLLRVLLFQR